jgi:pyruvate carboxylase
MGIDAVKKAGGVAEAAISYTGDVSDLTRKMYNLDYYLDLVDKLVSYGIHILAIKDMAGLLKPKAATILIGTIRKRYPKLVIHVHTHDTAGTGVASMIACAEAGADVVDVAIDSMSGLTSQPSMGAIVGAFKGTELDTGINPEDIYSINSYWEQIRLLYSPFDPNVKSGDSGVYLHEMPGGQYTNLLFQSQQLGLGTQWVEVKQAYRIANKLCGDITKVTPSSKVVGDLAQFIVAQKLTEQDVIDRAETLSFPKSVLEYFQGYLGQPPYGFPEPLRSRILDSRNLTRIQGRPGSSLQPFDFANLRTTLEDKYGSDNVNDFDVMSSALYPQVYETFRDTLERYGNLSTLPTKQFLTPLKVGEEFSFEFDTGKTLIVKLVAVGPLNEETSNRDVYFSLNGEARLISIQDTTTNQSASKAKVLTSRRKANPKEKLEIGAPMVIINSYVEWRCSRITS